MQQPKCPNCGRKKHHQQSPREWRCLACNALFDPVDDGEVYTDPTKRLRLKENRTEKRRDLKGGL